MTAGGVYAGCELDGVDVELREERLSSKGCGAMVRARLARGGGSAVDSRTRGPLLSLAMIICCFFWSLGFSHLGPGSFTQPSSTWQTLSGSPDMKHLWQDGLPLEQTCLIFAQYSHGFGVT